MDRQKVLQEVRARQDIRMNPNTGIFNHLKVLNKGGLWVPITEEFEMDGYRILGVSRTDRNETSALYFKIGTFKVELLSDTGTVPPPSQPPVVPSPIRIFDLNGAPQTMDFVNRKFGATVIRAEAQPGEKVWRVVEIREAQGQATLTIATLNEAGQRQPHMTVVRHWPDAQQIQVPLLSRWKPNGDVAQTKEDPITNGAFSFAIGGGDDYYRDVDKGINGFGVSGMWVGDPLHKSDLADRLGWLSETQYRRLDFTFQLM